MRFTRITVSLALVSSYGSTFINADPSSPVKTTKRSANNFQPSNAAKRTRHSCRRSSVQPNSSENDGLKANNGINDKEVESKEPMTYADISKMTTDEQALTALADMLFLTEAEKVATLGCFFSDEKKTEFGSACNDLLGVAVKLIRGGYGHDYSPKPTSAFAQSDADLQAALNRLGDIIEKHPGNHKANMGSVPTGDEDAIGIFNYATLKDWKKKIGRFCATLLSSPCIDVWNTTIPELIAKDTNGSCDGVNIHYIVMSCHAFTIDPKAPNRNKLFEAELDRFCKDFDCTREEMYIPFIAKTLYASIKHFLKHGRALPAVSFTLQSTKVFDIDASATKIMKFSMIFQFLYRFPHGEMYLSFNGQRMKNWSLERVEEIQSCIIEFFRVYISGVNIPDGAISNFMIRHILGKEHLTEADRLAWKKANQERGSALYDNQKGIFDPSKMPAAEADFYDDDGILFVAKDKKFPNRGVWVKCMDIGICDSSKLPKAEADHVKNGVVIVKKGDQFPNWMVYQECKGGWVEAVDGGLVSNFHLKSGEAYAKKCREEALKLSSTMVDVVAACGCVCKMPLCSLFIIIATNNQLKKKNFKCPTGKHPRSKEASAWKAANDDESCSKYKKYRAETKEVLLRKKNALTELLIDDTALKEMEEYFEQVCSDMLTGPLIDSTALKEIEKYFDQVCSNMLTE